MAREIKALLDEEIAAYAARNPRSQAMFARAVQSLPGGNTRTGVHIDPFPLYADRGEGTYLYDIDGHRLIDFVNNNTALPLGHAHPAIVTALQEQIARGHGFFAASRPRSRNGRSTPRAHARTGKNALLLLGHRSRTQCPARSAGPYRAHQDRQVRGSLSRHRRQRAGKLLAATGAGIGTS